MPSANRRQPSPDMEQLENDIASEALPSDEEVADDLLEGELGDDEDGVIEQAHRQTAPPPAPRGLKEISSLASWTTSSAKPGCGVTALRAPNTSLYWQSDGPQPHFLNIHFFKLVEIVGIRVYLDHELDESYTPTLIRFAAGMGYNDLQEFAVMKFEAPKGWLDVDFEEVGDPDKSSDEDPDTSMDGDDEKENMDRRNMPILRAMLVQVRICENHQNGKDTHLRGLQIFARDQGVRRGPQRERATSVGASVGVPNQEQMKRRREEKMWEVPEWAMVSELR